MIHPAQVAGVYNTALVSSQDRSLHAQYWRNTSARAADISVNVPRTFELGLCSSTTMYVTTVDCETVHTYL